MAAPAPETDLDTLLGRARKGDQAAMQEAFALVSSELRALAERMLAREPSGHTLQPTALVNEAYLKLCRQRSTACEERSQFLGVAAQAMRRILVDHARSRRRDKRDRGRNVTLDAAMLQFEQRSLDLVALDEALTRLSARDSRLGQVVELRFFAGLNPKETADTLGIGLRTCERDWNMARAWLRRQLAS